jgi:tricorn protease
MKRTFASVVLTALLAGGLTSGRPLAADVAGEPLRLMRYPDINAGRIVFSYQNDLWIVAEEGGTARRLTVHTGTEVHPKFSPEGKWIAYSGDYNERRNSCMIISLDGGSPRQLTFHTLGGYPVAWSRDGKNVVFASKRESFVRFYTTLFTVPAEGGLPVELEMGKASFASYSPDGGKIAYNRHPDLFWWWKRYRGSMNQDVWIYDFSNGEFSRITDYEGNDSWPMWTGNRIYFASDRNGGVFNIFVHDLETGDTRQVTSFEDRGVTWPSMSGDGSKIVFERDARLYVLDTASEQAREVVVYAPIDFNRNMVSYIDPLGDLRSFAISPTGVRLVFEARGEIFTAPAEHGDVRNLTQSSGARDSDPSWSPDGKWIAYVSDKSGDEEIYLIDQMGKGEEKRITNSGHFKRFVLWSPKSDKLLYNTENSCLYVVDIDGGVPELIARNEHRNIETYSWSPDGRWVAYEFAVKNRNRDIYIHDLKEKESHRVTWDLGDDYEPVFTPDGKYLLLITDREGQTPILARISLLPEKEAPFEHEDDEETGITDEEDEEDEGDKNSDEDTDKEEGEKKGKKGKKDKKKEKVVVKIDFEGIESRLRKLPGVRGREIMNVQATETKYYYQILAKRIFMFKFYDLYAFDLEKLESTKLITSIYTYALSADQKKLAYYDGKDFYIVKAGAKVGAKKADSDDDGKGKVDLKRKTMMKLDRRDEWGQIFDEAWRVVKYHFYDPNLHGVDWDEVKRYYQSLLPYVHTRSELNLLLTEMVGELNASHQGVGGGEEISVPTTVMGFLGAKLVLDPESGFPRFERIYKGDNVDVRNFSPLDHEYVEIREGDFLLAIDGHELQPGENFYGHLVGKTRNKITIKTNGKPTLKDAKETTFKPISTDIRLKYNDWVQGSTEYVEKVGAGRIGYMHLPDMMGAGWVEFQEKFEKFRYKDAIIIDVRYNGGGNIDYRIIDLLERRPYQITKERNMSPIERPDDGFYGEVVVLINEYSFSDAEVFPSAVKERGLGTLIGVPTLGYCIAVNSHPLIDGGQIRKTFIGIWELSTGRMIESRGVEPDILVESPPEMEKAGRDVQLEKAVEFLMGRIGDTPREYDYEIPIRER